MTSKIANKSYYTFIVVEGEEFDYELSAFYLNQKTNALSEVSASPQNTPKHLKIKFGFIERCEQISGDSKFFKIINKNGKELLLQMDKLSPKIDEKDSQLKRLLINLSRRGDCKDLVKNINDIICAFHQEENRIIFESSYESDKENQEVNSSHVQAKVYLDQSLVTSESQSNEDLPTGQGFNDSTLEQSLTSGLDYESESGNETVDSSVNMTPPRTQKRKADDTESPPGSNDETLYQRLVNVIQSSHYACVNLSDIKIPAEVTIDRNRVSQLKGLLNTTIDKTQTILGLIQRVDKHGSEIGKKECWVNPEFYMAVAQNQLEQKDKDNSSFHSVVHVVQDFENEQDLESTVIGTFLRTNSKEFSTAMRQNLTYQDLLRLAVASVAKNHTKEGIEFVKQTIKSFSKGLKNANTFLHLALLEESFVKKLLSMCKLYEDGSLYGMHISSRKKLSLDRDMKKKNSAKLEVPLHLLKLHLAVSAETRNYLLESLLKKDMTFKRYVTRLTEEANLCEVISAVEKISNKSIESLRKEHPVFFSNDTLSDFFFAKDKKDNQQYNRLLKHVESAMNYEYLEDNNSSGSEAKLHFKIYDGLTTPDIVKEVTSHHIYVFIRSSTNLDVNDKLKFAFLENANDDRISVFVNTNIVTEKDGFQYFNEDVDKLRFEPVWYKMDKPVVKNGFKKEFSPIFVLGRENKFRDKEISSVHYEGLQGSISSLIQEMCNPYDKVIVSFNDLNLGFDIDPYGILSRKNVSITYLSSMDNIRELKLKIKPK